MKFSILIPTRNRLELLKTAIFSVIHQDFDDWELIVSDNFSEEDVCGYVQSLKDPRIKCYRTTSFVSVTDNWNNALEKSSGNYVIMLGDDDCLMKGYFSTVNKLLEEYPNPDFIYTSGFTYAYPGVIPGYLHGFLRVFGNAHFLQSQRHPFWLSRDKATRYVRDAMNFKVMFAYNMQYALICRPFIDEIQLKGKFFQTPYPDYYAMTAMMLKAKKILACPIPLVTVGISPKSFGFYYFNQRENEGCDFLKNIPGELEQSKLERILLPGTQMNSSWLFSMEAIKVNYGNEFVLSVNYNRYRFLQIVKVFKRFALKGRRDSDIAMLWNNINMREKLFYGYPFYLISFALRMVPSFLRKKIANRLENLCRSHPAFDSQTVEAHYSSAVQVFENVDPKAYSPS